MIGKVCRRGSNVRRLLGYLFTEGLAGEHGLESEHRDPHVIAGYEPAGLLEPARDAQGRPQLTRLSALLHAPVKAGGVGPEAKPVYHLAISAAPGDRLLTDTEWADIAGQYVLHLGLAPQDDPDGVRWVAVRHADNHVHVVATLVRQDGRRVFPHHDFYRARETSLAVEQQYGLTRTSTVDRTAVAGTTRAEQRKHRTANAARARAGLAPAAGADRDVLRTLVRQALTGTDGWDEFATRLYDSGVLVRERYSTHTPDQLTGYAVALLTTGPRALGGQTPVWFGGGKLAPDLSLPQLQARWTTDTTGASRTNGGRAPTRVHPGERPAPANGHGPDPRASTPTLTDQERQRLWQQAANAVADGTQQIRQTMDPSTGSAGRGQRDEAAQAAAGAASEMLSAVGRLTEGRRGGPLSNAAASFDRAARAPHRRTVPATLTSRRMRTAAGRLLQAGIVKRAETRQLLELLDQLNRLVAAVAVLRERQHQAAQARAAEHAAEQLLAERQRRAAAAAALFAPVQQQAPTVTVTMAAAYRPAARPPRPPSSSR